MYIVFSKKYKNYFHLARVISIYIDIRTLFFCFNVPFILLQVKFTEYSFSAFLQYNVTILCWNRVQLKSKYSLLKHLCINIIYTFYNVVFQSTFSVFFIVCVTYRMWINIFFYPMINGFFYSDILKLFFLNHGSLKSFLLLFSQYFCF